MKIGILTFHRSINNGAVMQCYSLSKRLQQEFPDDTVEVIDYHMPLVDKKVYSTYLRHYFRGNLFSKLKTLVRLPYYLNKIKQDIKRKEAFDEALHYLPLSTKKIYSNSMDSLIDFINANYDVVIAGSDAIWNYVVRGFPNPYFLSQNVSCRKFSYAASCYGMNYERIPSDQRDLIKDILNSYEFLGTRDGESEKFLEFLGCSVLPTHTCDPTAFLDVDDLPVNTDELVSKLIAKGFDFSRKTIGVMGSADMCKMLRKMFGREYQLVSLYNYNKLCDVNLNDLSPYEWAYVFRYFSVTVTTYFHGTMLSLRNGVPVVCIALPTEYSKHHITKVEDVLTRLDFKDFYFETDYKSINLSKIKEKIELCLSLNLRDKILERINIEATYVQPFIEHIKIGSNVE